MVVSQHAHALNHTAGRREEHCWGKGTHVGGLQLLFLWMLFPGRPGILPGRGGGGGLSAGLGRFDPHLLLPEALHLRVFCAAVFPGRKLCPAHPQESSEGQPLWRGQEAVSRKTGLYQQTNGSFSLLFPVIFTHTYMQNIHMRFLQRWRCLILFLDRLKLRNTGVRMMVLKTTTLHHLLITV